MSAAYNPLTDEQIWGTDRPARPTVCPLKTADGACPDGCCECERFARECEWPADHGRSNLE